MVGVLNLLSARFVISPTVLRTAELLWRIFLCFHTLCSYLLQCSRGQPSLSVLALFSNTRGFYQRAEAVSAHCGMAWRAARPVSFKNTRPR